jgi:hypothetical protein
MKRIFYLVVIALFVLYADCTKKGGDLINGDPNAIEI